MKIGIVIPWFSESPSGGAERFAGGLAKAFAQEGYITDILTTCGKDSFWDWGKDYYEEGSTDYAGVTIRRFSLDMRNKKLYEKVFGKMSQREQLKYSEQMQMLHETVNSQSMYKFIYMHKNDYVFIFMPYLFGITFWGTKIAPERSFLLPCLHNEEMAHLTVVKQMFHRVQGSFFNTVEEMTLAKEIYDLQNDQFIVSGGGVELEYQGDPSRFKQKYNINFPYILYVGRKVAGKNAPLLVELFKKFTSEINVDLKLLLIGKAEEGFERYLDGCESIIDIGEVDERTKIDAMSGALALCQPSVMESFSIVIMESWLSGTPVIVHEHCEVTKGHVDRSKGGVYFHDYMSFKEQLFQLLNNEVYSNKMSINGKCYVEENYSWRNTVNKMVDFIKSKDLRDDCADFN